MSDQWREIETAPKDQRILVWCDGAYDVVWWLASKSEGAWTDGEYTWGELSFWTHWMPLPEPPK